MDDAAPLGRGSARAGRAKPPSVGRRAAGYVRLAALLVLLVGCGGQGSGRQPPPATVGVVTVEAQPVTLTTELPGRTSPYEVADVRPQVGGIIVARLFSEGSVVHAGQVLYQIEPAPFLAAYDQARAQLANAEANLVTTRLKAQRFAALVKQDSVAAQDYDDAEAAFKEAQATVQQDRAAAEAARINLAFTRITAPITGRIGISTVTKGALVTRRASRPRSTPSSGSTRSTSTSPSRSPRWWRCAGRWPRVRLTAGAQGSAEAHLTLDDGTSYPLAGQLQFTDVTVDQTTDAVTLRAVFPNPAGALAARHVRARDDRRGRRPGRPAGARAGRRPRRERPADRAGGQRQGRQSSCASCRSRQTVANKWLVTSGLASGRPGDRRGSRSQPSPGAQVRAVPADNVR